MPKTKKATGAEKPAIEKPYILAKDEPTKPKHLQSRDLGRRLEVEEPKFTPPERGPMTGASLMTDADFVRAYGTVEELAAFRATIQARRERTGSVGWRRLPNGTQILANLILAVCPRCRAALWVKEAAGPCPVCNFQRLVDGGHLRPATPAEEKAWFVREEGLQRKRIAALPKAKAELDEFNRRHLQDLPRDKDGRL